MSYLKAVLKKDHQTKITELEKLITLGEKLGKDTTPDKKKLEIILKRQNKNNEVKTVSIGKKITNTIPTKNTFIKKGKNSIQSIYTFENSIIINYKNTLSKDIVRFFELKQSPLYKDVYDLKGNYLHVKNTKLKINGVDKLVVGQFKHDILRVVIANKKNLRTSYKIDGKQVVITINDLKVKKTTPTKAKTTKTQNNDLNKYIDTRNKIRQIYTKNDRIIVKFNQNISKRDFKYTAFKNRGYYNDIFDIKGKYKYAKPIKLSIDGLDKISVGQTKTNNLRIRISNKKDLKVYYAINKKELSIRIVGLNKSSKKSTNNTTLPYANFKSKVIVIDPGHGGKDVGAVGPYKRYEKVVTLKISKYLHSILKQRGHKVYLTRSSDRFIKVGNRTDLARKKNADVFISIHANSVPKSKASKVSGIETYYLSPAKSERAKRVAAKENKADSRKMSRATIDAAFGAQNYLVMKNSHALSVAVQSKMLESIRKRYSVKDKGARTGPFWVLLDAPKASILVEVGFISHPVESKRLYTSDYQKKLALGMANGIEFYFQNPIN